jgi:hypothetical protein
MGSCNSRTQETLLNNQQSPAERLYEDGWRGVLQFLTGNEIAKVSGVSKTLRSISYKAGVWATAISTIKLPQAPIFDDVHKWRLSGKDVVLKVGEFSESNENVSIPLAISTIIFSNNICSNLQILTLQLPASLHVIRAFCLALQGRLQTGYQLKKLVLDLHWIYDDDGDVDIYSRELIMGLKSILPEEVEIRCTANTDLHGNYRYTMAKVLRYNKSTFKVTLPGSLWAESQINSIIGTALLRNTIRSLTFTAPQIIEDWEYAMQPYKSIDCFAKMLINPSLRHLSVADFLPPELLCRRNGFCNYSALYFADPEIFSKSTLETLHLELANEAPYGLLEVLYAVAEMPQLQRFTMSWPVGGYSAPREVSMERLREFLKPYGLSEVHKKRAVKNCWDVTGIPVLRWYSVIGTVHWNALNILFI